MTQVIKQAVNQVDEGLCYGVSLIQVNNSFKVMVVNIVTQFILFNKNYEDAVKANSSYMRFKRLCRAFDID